MISGVDQLSVASVLEDIFSTLQQARDALAILGMIYASKILYNVLVRCFAVTNTYIIPRFFYPSNLSSKYGGSWAVVTGASEGIGKAFAMKLAERKMNVVLISRSSDKLQTLAKQIQLNYNVQTRLVAVDLSQLSEESCYEKLKLEIETLDIGILVNNVGAMYDRLQYFLTVPKPMHMNIIDLNIKATVLMTHMILPRMLAKRNGAILNIGSISSIHPTPLMTTYSAAKSFTDMFTRALEYEYSSEGITIQIVRPSYVSTSLTNLAKPNFLVCNPDDCVESTLRALGKTRSCYGYWKHAIFGYFGELMPERFYMFCATYVNPILYRWVTGIGEPANKSD